MVAEMRLKKKEISQDEEGEQLPKQVARNQRHQVGKRHIPRGEPKPTYGKPMGRGREDRKYAIMLGQL